MSRHLSRRLLVLCLIAILTTGLNAGAGLAQIGNVSWTAAPGGAGTMNGLTPRYDVGDPWTATTDCGSGGVPLPCGRPAVRFPALGYMYFAVDDSYIAPGVPADAEVEISYFDRGYTYFYVVHDSQSGPGKESFTWGTTSSPDPTGSRGAYQSNNIVYLQNSNTWKTYKFNLSNVYFNNAGPLTSDFKITFVKGGGNEVARQGYDLRIDRVTVTKFATPIDVTGHFEGNYSGFGGPSWIWTQLGTINEQGHGLYQDEATGPTTVATGDGKTGRRLTGGNAYFNVNDNYVLNGVDEQSVPVKSAVIGVEYFDAGTGSFSVQYDGASAPLTAGTVNLTNTNTWRRAPFYAPDGRFGNGLNGNDFRVVSPTSNLLVRDVAFGRTIGENRQGTVPTGFSQTQRVVGVHHLPVFDGFRPGLWEKSTLAPRMTASDTYNNDSGGNPTANASYSYRSIETNRKELTDMRDAGIDFALIWYGGNSQDSNITGVVGTRQLVAAAAQVTNAPKVGLLLDPVNVVTDRFFRVGGEKIDLRDPGVQGLLIKFAEDFYSLVPRDRWATIEGRPIIALYYQGSDLVSYNDTGVIAKLRERFVATHGVQPYIIADRLWDPNDSLGLPVDEWFSWGAAHCDSCPGTSPGYGQRSVFEVGPGFNDGTGPTRFRDRENGAFYSRSWDRAIAKGNHMVLIDTFNYFPEGSAIGETTAYGRTYLDITAQKAAGFKTTGYGSASTASVTLGTANSSQGIAQDDLPDHLTTADSRGGRRALNSAMYFSVDDSFILGNAGQATISIKYLDADVGRIDLKYLDASGHEVGTLRRITVGEGSSGTFKVATFTIDDAAFTNRLTFANDFWLDADVAGKMVIQSVSISRGCPAAPTSVGGTTVPALQPGHARLFMPVGFKRACAS